MSLLQGIQYNFQMYGVRGLLLATAARLSGRQVEAVKKHPGLRHPFHCRIRTYDGVAFQQMIVERQYDIDLPFIPRTIVDAGANCGGAAVFFANKYPDARIVAIEPDAGNFAALQKNCAPYPNITPIRAALWGSDGELSVTDPGDGTFGFRTTTGSGVRAVSMGTLMREQGLDAVDILKVDIEGAESDVFASPAEWIHKARSIFIELHDRFQAGCSQRFYLATAGFEPRRSVGEIAVMIHPYCL